MSNDESKNEVTSVGRATHILPLSAEERDSILKGFAYAFLRGEIKIPLPSADAYKEFAKLKGQSSDTAGVFVEIVKDTLDFTNNIGVCLGTVPSAPEEFEAAKQKLFSSLLALRLIDGMEGKFLEAHIEERVTDLEERLNLLEPTVMRLLMKGGGRGSGQTQ